MIGSLDEREQRVALLAAALAAVSSVALWAPLFEQPRAVGMAGLGVAMAALLALAARSRRRLPTGVAAMVLAFGPWGFAWVIGFPYLCLAAWLLFRRRSPPAEPEATGPADQRGRR
ncbi:MAG: hypothetical protein M3N68_04295, partial [Actinomycetota bacterium]|nr:hypothetical protein [Actinomycetota bacterium]